MNEDLFALEVFICTDTNLDVCEQIPKVFISKIEAQKFCKATSYSYSSGRLMVSQASYDYLSRETGKRKGAQNG